MPNNQRTPDNHWHMDKRVPLSIILALVIQTVYFTVFITKLDSRVASLETSAIDVRKTIEDMSEIRVHQSYIREELRDISKFLRDDVEWVKPKRGK